MSSRKFAVAILCADATFSDLLVEAEKHNVTVLEMIPAQSYTQDFATLLKAGHPLLFVHSAGKSDMVTRSADIPAVQAVRPS